MKKRLCNGVNSESWWQGLSPEIFALIVARIPSDEIARTIPFVSRSWRDLIDGPDSWSVIDIEQWCRRCNRTDVIDPVVRKLVRRSKGMVRCISAYKLGYSAFSFLASSGKHLEVMKMPVSSVTDKMVAKHVASFSNLTVIDVSYCLHITCRGLEAFGKQCKSLIHLRRNMPPPEIELGGESPAQKVDDDEALAIADTMPGLLHLELSYGRFTDLGLDAILTKCKALHHLDIRGCWNVKLTGDLEEKCEMIDIFRSPWDDEYDDASSSDDGNEAATSSDFSD
ncbi:F-box protein FBW2-like [Magnolia sinica]|uniref:F-box protein FBW2-like n=1 Tax=Magnolia sinica TaxID=86752 RepID=UPI00265AD83A|nr:F-box protein FBW2-like [Magnolia sinica]